MFLNKSELLKNKLIFLTINLIYGIGNHSSFLICKQIGFSQNFKTSYLSKKQIVKINKKVGQLNKKLADDLKKLKLLLKKELIRIKSYKGLKINKGLPTRGQWTWTNAKTSKKKLNF